MNDNDKNNSALLCDTFRSAISGALTGPLGKTSGSPDSVVAALLAVTADFSRAIGVDFTHMACSMVAAVESDREKAVGSLISCYARGAALRTARPEPEAERVEFTAERDGDIWTIYAKGLIHSAQVRSGGDRYPIGPLDTLRITWGDSMPPKPIEVWIERGRAEGA